MLLCAFSQTLFWSARAHQYLITHVRQRQSRCLPDYFSEASSERRPLLCTANPCASPLHQQVTEVSKSQGLGSCRAYNIASSALGQTPLHAPNALYETGSRLQFRPRAPQNSPGGRVRLASCILHSPEMILAPKKSWFGSRTAEQSQLQDAASLQYINNYAAPDLCRFRYNSEVTPGETLQRNGWAGAAANAVWTRPKPPKTRNPRLRLKGMRGTQGDNTTFIIIISY